MITNSGDLTGRQEAHVLKSCPPASSVGIQVESIGRPFLWLPGQLPSFVSEESVSHLKVECPDWADGFSYYGLALNTGNLNGPARAPRCPGCASRAG